MWPNVKKDDIVNQEEKRGEEKTREEWGRAVSK